MQTTIDTGTGRKFRYNEIVTVGGINVPGRTTARKQTHLHPGRVLPELLAKLNPGMSAAKGKIK